MDGSKETRVISRRFHSSITKETYPSIVSVKPWCKFTRCACCYLVQQGDGEVESVGVEDASGDTGSLVDIVLLVELMVSIWSMGHICKQPHQQPVRLKSQNKI